jgi:hypothetical protein
VHRPARTKSCNPRSQGLSQERTIDEQELAMRIDPTPFKLPADVPPTGALMQRDRRPVSGEQQHAFASLWIDRDVEDGRLPLVALTPGERAVMAAHRIQFDGRGFRFAGFRHDHLVDAVRQSRRAGQGRE